MQKFKKYILLSKFLGVVVFCISMFICKQSYFCQTAIADFYAPTLLSDVTFSPDNKRIAAATSEGIWLFDAQTYQRRLIFRGSAGFDYRPGIVLFSPDGDMLTVVGRGTKEIQLFRPSDAELILTLKGSQDETSCIAFSPDGKTLASGNDGKTILLWDLDTGNLFNTLKGHTDKVSSIAFSPDGKTLASASYDKTIRLWNAHTGELRKTLKGHTDIIHSVAFSPDGKMLVSSGHQKMLLWDGHTGKHLKTVTGIKGSVESIAFSTDGGMFAAGTDQEIKLWDIKNDEFHPSPINFRLTAAAKNILKGAAGLEAIEFSPDGQTLAHLCSWDGFYIRFFDVKTGQYRGIISEPQRNTKRLTSFSPDVKRIARTTHDGLFSDVIRFWQIPTEKLLMPIPPILTLKVANTRFSKVQKEFVKSTHFSPDGKLVASVSNSEIVLWDAVKGTPKTILKDPPTQFYSFAFSPDSRTLATGDGWNNYLIRLWDTNTGKLKTTLKGHNAWIDSLAYSPDGKILVSGNRDGTICVWNPKTGEQEATFQGHTKLVRSIVFSPNGKLFASTSNDNTVILCDMLSILQKGQPKVIFDDHTTRIYQLKFSPDSRKLVGRSGDTAIRLWDTKTGQHTTTLQGHESWIDFLDFSTGWTNID